MTTADKLAALMEKYDKYAHVDDGEKWAFGQVAAELRPILAELQRGQLVSSDHEVDKIGEGERLERVRYQREGESLITANVVAWYATAVYWRYKAELQQAQGRLTEEQIDNLWWDWKDYPGCNHHSDNYICGPCAVKRVRELLKSALLSAPTPAEPIKGAMRDVEKEIGHALLNDVANEQNQTGVNEQGDNIFTELLIRLIQQNFIPRDNG